MILYDAKCDWLLLVVGFDGGGYHGEMKFSSGGVWG